ncbi:MAG: oligoendopeptidase F [Tumebacillaceae bacterium]
MNKSQITKWTAVTIALSLVAAPIVPGRAEARDSAQAAASSDPAFATQAPSYKARTDIPAAYKWRLEDIYPNQAAWEADAKKATKLAGDFTKHQGKLGTTVAELKQTLDDFCAMSRVQEKLYLYAKLSFDVNTGNPNQQALADRAEKIGSLMHEKTAWLVPELIAVPDAQMHNMLVAPELSGYKLFIQDILRSKPHTLSKEAEGLLAQTSPLLGQAEDTWQMLSKDVKLPTIQGEGGSKVQLTRASYPTFMESKDRNVRRAAFQAYYQTIGKYQDTFASTLAGEVKANNFGSKARKFNSAMEASLTSNDVPVKVYNELIETVDKNIPLLQRYMRLKQKLLGLPELHMYDLHTPVVQVQRSYIPYSQAKQMVLDGLKPLGDDYVATLKKGFDSGWVDVYSTEDKKTGAYQWGSYDTHPYLLLNYQGTADDVSTIAHEMGHAMQSYYTNKKQPYITSGYPIFTAEVASTLNETLLFKRMYAHAQTKEEKIYLLTQYLDNFRGTLFRQTQFAEFEKAIHEKEQAGESLNAEHLKKIYYDINKKYFGDSVVSDPEIALEWARVPHFFNGFYVYQYATSFAASTALAKQVLEEGKPAVDRIRDNFLSAGSSKPPLEVLKAAGVDMSTPKPIEEACKLFAEELDDLEQLTK